MTIKYKILIPMILLSIICSALILLSSILLFNGYVDDTVAEEIDIASSVTQWEFDQYKEKAYIAAAGFAENISLIDTIQNGSRNSLLELCQDYQSSMGFDFLTLTDAAGNVLIMTYDPTNSGHSAESHYSIQSAISGKAVTTVEEDSAIRFAICSGAPVYDGEGNLIGALSVGYRLDTFDFVDNVSEMTGCEITVFLGDERISTTVKKDDGSRLVGTKADPTVSSAVLAGEEYTGKAMILDRSALTKYTPIYDADNKIVGMLFAGKYTDDTITIILSFIRTGFLIMLAVIAASVVFSLFLSMNIELQIKNIIQSIKESIMRIGGSTKALSSISTNLSEGASTQAASIQETSATMNETSSMIAQNAEHTRTAAILASKSKDSANTGREKMLDMLSSMNEIKESSDTISKIINTIDDIAFQTNLLALNATIEAARAGGDAGRSFAVVANEVRNLAQRSANAAADTTSIIEKNISLTNKGRTISSEVSESLDEIVEEFDKLSDLISEISTASDEQSNGIRQINIAVNQMEKSTQHNAAMAEETTSSSQDLESEIISLENVIVEAEKLINKNKA